MKKIAILFLLTFSSLFYAQNDAYKIETFEALKLKKSKAKIFFIGNTKDNGLVVVRQYLNPSQYTNKESYFFQHYDKNNKLINNVQIKHTQIGRVWLEDDKLYYIESTKKQSQNRQNISQREVRGLQKKLQTNAYNIILHEASLNDFIFKEKKVLHQLERPLVKNFDSFFFSNNITTRVPYSIFSKNKEYMACVYETKTEEQIISNSNDYQFSESVIPIEAKKTYSNPYKIIMFKKGQDKPLYTQNFILNHSSDWTLDTNNFCINEQDGSLFFLESEKLDKKKFIDFRKKIQQTTNIVKVDSVKVLRVNINSITPEKLSGLNNIRIHKGRIYLITSYSTFVNEQRLEGISKIELSNELKALTNDRFPLTEQFYNDRIEIFKSLNKRKPEKKAFQFESMLNGSIFFDDDDNLIVNLIEAKHISQTTYNSGFGYSPGISFFKYLNAFVAKISNNNQLLWSRCMSVRSNIYNSFTGYSGEYYFLNSDHQNFILFDKSPTNINNESLHTPYSYTNTLIEIDENGKLDYDYDFLKRKDTKNDSKTSSFYLGKSKTNTVYIDRGKGKTKTLTKVSF